MKTRRRFTAEFKAKVALEAMQGHRTITDLASRHELHPNLIMQWKRQAIEKLAKVFDDKAPEIQAGRDAEMTKLHAKIGQARGGTRFFGESLRSLSLDRRRTMIDPDHPRLSIVRQCELASVSRASFYREPAGEREENLVLMQLIDEAFLRGRSSPASHSRRRSEDAEVRISMDGRGRWMDNVFIERLWRSLKYECVFLNAFETGGAALDGIGRWLDYYNRRRPHSALGDRTPDEAYGIEIDLENLAA